MVAVFVTAAIEHGSGWGCDCHLAVTAVVLAGV